eukprot:gene22340-28460_t
MDMLSALFVSLATLSENGLVNVTQLLLAMKNLYVALARNALPSALYTILLADKSRKTSAAPLGESEDTAALSNTMSDDADEEERESVDETEPMDVDNSAFQSIDFQSIPDESQSQSADRKSELFDLFGFGDSDDEEEEKEEGGGLQNAMKVEIANSSEQISFNEVASTESIKEAEPTESSTVTPALSSQRQGLDGLLGDFLAELLLSASQDVSLGLPIALLEAFPCRHSGSNLCGAIRNPLRMLCEVWIDLFSARLTDMAVDGALRNVTAEVLKRLRTLRLAVSDDLDKQPSSTVVDLKLSDLSKLLTHKLGETMRRTNPTDEFRLRVSLAARQAGFWQSVITIGGVKLGNKLNSKSNVLGLLSLDFLTRDAESMIVLMRKCNLLDTFKGVGNDNVETGRGEVTFTELIEGSCHLSLEAVDATDDEEVLAVNHFRRHWKHTLSSNDDLSHSVRDCIAIISSLMESLLRSELSGGGWRTGHSGDGLSIESRLRNRMEVASDLMRKVPQLGWHSKSVTLSTRHTKHNQKQAASGTRWYRYCSVSHDEICHATSFLDHCVSQTAISRAHGSSAPVLTREEALAQQQAWSSISALTKDIAALVAASVVERSLFLTVSSLRALLLVLNEMESAAIGGSMLTAMDEAVRFLLVIPAPWGAACGARSDIVHEVKNAIYFRRRFSRQLNLSPSTDLSKLTSNWTTSIARRLPAFVINLDRRTDRWRKFLLMNERLGVTFLRVRAVDGASSAHTDGDEEGVSRSSLGHVSESDVTSCWDSTLNNQFDQGCMVNTHTPLTPAERACAASHLKVWRTIASIRSRLSLDGVVQGLVKEDTVDHLGCSSSGSSGASDAHSVFAAYCRTASPHAKQSATTTLLLDADLDHYLVFEDDAAVSLVKQASFRKEVAFLMRKLPSDVDVLYLGGAVPRKAPAYRSKAMCNKLFFQAFVVAEEVVGQSQRTLKGRRHESDIRHSGRVTIQQEYASRSSAVASADKSRFVNTSSNAPPHFSRREE